MRCQPASVLPLLLTPMFWLGCLELGTTNNTNSSGGNGGTGGRTESSSSSSSSASSSASSSSSTSSSASSSSSSGSGGGACDPASRLIYVLASDDDIFSFDPPTKKFTKRGLLTCTNTMAPNSIAVDRSGTAWVNYVKTSGGNDVGGVIFKASTVDASCDPTPVVQLDAGWYRLGMGFSADGPGQSKETLFLFGIEAKELGKLDDMLQVKVIGTFSPGMFGAANAELTGNADGYLFGYFTTSPVKVGQIDKVSAAVSNAADIASVQSPSAWAHAFWGGSLYLFTAGFAESTVRKYDLSTGLVDDTYTFTAGLRVVGAGVSTCAPLTPP